MHGRTDGWIDGCVDGWAGEGMDRCTDGWKDGMMEAWKDGCVHIHININIYIYIYIYLFIYLYTEIAHAFSCIYKSCHCIVDNPIVDIPSTCEDAIPRPSIPGPDTSKSRNAPGVLSN